MRVGVRVREREIKRDFVCLREKDTERSTKDERKTMGGKMRKRGRETW